MDTKESIKNEIFTLESRELNEGKKVAFKIGRASCRERV